MLIRQYRPARFEFDGRDVGNNDVEIHEGQHQLIIHLALIPPR